MLNSSPSKHLSELISLAYHPNYERARSGQPILPDSPPFLPDKEVIDAPLMTHPGTLSGFFHELAGVLANPSGLIASPGTRLKHAIFRKHDPKLSQGFLGNQSLFPNASRFWFG